MSIGTYRTALIGRVWQSIAQSGVDVSALSQEQLERLVSAIADGVLVEVDQLLGSASANEETPTASVPVTSSSGEVEQVLWEGRPFLSLGEHYVVTNERVRIISGLLSKSFEDIELLRIQDIDFSQGVGERMLNIGDIVLHTSDASQPDITLRNIADPVQVHETIRRAMLDARRRYRVGFREQL